MTKHLRFLFVMLLAMIWSAGWAQTTVEQTVFTAISSDNIDGDKNVSFSCDKGGGTANPNINSNMIQLYQIDSKSKIGYGNTITISIEKGYEINSVTIGTNKESSVAYTLDSETTLSATTKVNANKEFSVTKLSANSITFYCMGTAKANRFMVNKLSVTYSATGSSNKTATSLSFPKASFSFATTDDLSSFTGQTATLSSEGTTLTGKSITYSKFGDNIFSSFDTANGTFVLNGNAGTATVTATFAGDDTYASASAEYTLNVVDPNKTDVTFDFTDPEKYGYSKPASNKSTDLSNGDKLESNRVTITSVQGGTNTKTRFFNSKNVILLRIYTGAILTVNAPAGFAINRIDFTDDSNSPVKNFTFSTGELNSKTWTGLAKNLTMKVDNNSVFLKNMTVNLVKLVELDENSESNTLEAKTGVNVTLKRSMVANEWNTICLPFDVTYDKAKAAFGDNVKIVELDTEAAVDANVLSFKASTGITAATPYLIKPSAVSETGTYTFEGVDITETNDGNPYSFNNVTNHIAFKGIFNMVDITKDVVDNVGASYYAAFLGAGNKIYKTDGSGNKTKGFRAYFAIPNGAAASALRVVIDGTATSIKNIDSEVVESNAPVYNLQGQRVDGNNLTPGIYVKAGKKFVVK